MLLELKVVALKLVVRSQLANGGFERHSFGLRIRGRVRVQDNLDTHFHIAHGDSNAGHT